MHAIYISKINNMYTSQGVEPSVIPYTANQLVDL